MSGELFSNIWGLLSSLELTFKQTIYFYECFIQVHFKFDNTLYHFKKIFVFNQLFKVTFVQTP